MKLRAPFSADTVIRLNAYQQSRAFHPFTCGGTCGGRSVLVAQEQGWVCPSCDYTQDWAHNFMADPRWLRRVRKTEG